MTNSIKCPNLLSPFEIGSLKLKNRVIMAPMSRGRAGPTGVANQLIADYYSQRSSCGLIITEGTHTSIMGRGWFHTPEVFNKEHAQGWTVVTDTVHQAGGLIFCQLWHAGRTSHSSFREGEPGYEDHKSFSIAPSAIKKKSESGKQSHTPGGTEVDVETPREITLEEIELLPEEFRNAAQIAKDGGFDGVEVHCANGFLLDTFLQCCSNKRTDKYGGSLENRFRIVEKILKAVFTVWDPKCVGVRIAPNGVYNGMGSNDYREAFLYYARRFHELGIGYLHIMIGLGFGFHDRGTPMTLAEFREVFSGAIMGNVGFDAESAEKEIVQGNADLISFGRPFLSNPDLVERFATGAELNPMLDFKYWYSSLDQVWTTDGYTDQKTVDQGAETSV